MLSGQDANILCFVSHHFCWHVATMMSEPFPTHAALANSVLFVC